MVIIICLADSAARASKLASLWSWRYIIIGSYHDTSKVHLAQCHFEKLFLYPPSIGLVLWGGEWGRNN